APEGHMVRHPLPLDEAAREAELALRREAFRELYPLFRDRTLGWRMSAPGSSVPATSVLRFDPATGQLMMRHADSPDWVPYRNDAGQTIRREGDTMVFEGPEYIERVDLRDNSVQVQWREDTDTAARRAGAAQQTSGSPGRPPEESAASGRRRRLSPTAEFDYVVARTPGGEDDWVDLFLSEG